jgi:hypothetical protein
MTGQKTFTSRKGKELGWVPTTWSEMTAWSD